MNADGFVQVLMEKRCRMACLLLGAEAGRKPVAPLFLFLRAC